MRASDRAAELYLDLLKRCLTRTLSPHEFYPLLHPGAGRSKAGRAMHAYLGRWLSRVNVGLYRRGRTDGAERQEGRDWPAEAETMIGRRRLDQLHACIMDVLKMGVPGDLLEAGVWRGGSAILMCAVLEAYGDRERRVWVADSFSGLPKPDGRYAQDTGDLHWKFGSVLAIPLDEVKANFERYGMLSERVQFLPGWFKDTLPRAGVERLALLRIDGDMYSSTMDALESLYTRLSAGGYVIIDDYGAVPACRQAVEDYRARQGIEEPLREVDWTAVYWVKRGAS